MLLYYIIKYYEALYIIMSLSLWINISRQTEYEIII